MRYSMFVCVDPDGEKYCQKRTTSTSGLKKWAGAKCEPSVTVSRA